MWEERDGRRTRLDGEKEIKKRISGRGRRGGGWLRKMGDEFGRVLHERKRNVVLA